MPKELTHWLLARRSAARLRTGPLADAVLAYDEFVLAGAVAHDAGYYAGAIGRPAGKRTADRLHGNQGWDTFAPFRALAAHRGLGAPALAFGFGALTHLAADAVFHPWVYSWTGDAEAPDAAYRRGWLFRHQALESALDRHLEAVWGPAPAATVAALARRAGPELPAVQSAFSGNDAAPWLEAHARLQGLFAIAPAGWLARAATWPIRGTDADPTGVFYRGGPRRHPGFEGTLSWVHPVSGQPDAASIEGLAERCDALVSELAPRWERLWTGEAPLTGPGPHLDTGLASDQPQDKRWFSGSWPARRPRWPARPQRRRARCRAWSARCWPAPPA